jgi:hypothetical protein
LGGAGENPINFPAFSTRACAGRALYPLAAAAYSAGMRLPNISLHDNGTRIAIAVFVAAALIGILIAFVALSFMEG